MKEFSRIKEDFGLKILFQEKKFMEKNFGKKKKLVGELIATLDRVDSTIDYIKDSVLRMQEEVDRSEKADDE